jgi:hypothetical protein
LVTRVMADVREAAHRRISALVSPPRCRSKPRRLSHWSFVRLPLSKRRY